MTHLRQDGMASKEAQQLIRGRMRTTFLLALTWKRWRDALPHASVRHSACQEQVHVRASIPKDMAVDAKHSHKLGRVFVGLQLGVQQGSDPMTRIQEHTSLRVESIRDRPMAVHPLISHRTLGGSQRRAAARLMHMLVRAPLIRCYAFAFCTWFKSATVSGHHRVLQEAHIAHSGTLTATQQALEEATADMQVQRGLRAIEVSRREQEQRKHNAEQLFSLAASIVVTNRKICASSALHALKAYMVTRSLHVALAVEEEKRQRMAMEILQLTETDAKMSQKLAVAVAQAQGRAQRAVLFAISSKLKCCVQRQLCGVVAAWRRVRDMPISRTRLIRHMRAVSLLALAFGMLLRKSLCEGWRSLSRPCRAHTSKPVDASCELVASCDMLDHAHVRYDDAHTSGTAASRMAERADKLTRLKTQLTLRQDFRTRVHSVSKHPATSTKERLPLFGDACLGDELSFVSLGVGPEGLRATNLRLSQGAACLLEYVLASALRVRLRFGLNAWLAFAAGSSNTTSTRGAAVTPASVSHMRARRDILSDRGAVTPVRPLMAQRQGFSDW